MPGALQLGKRLGRTLAATGVTGPTSSRLFFVSDTHTPVFLSTQVRKSVPFPLPPLTVDVHLIHLHSLLSTTHPYAPTANAPSPSTLVSDARYPGFLSLWTCRSQSSVPTFSDTMDSWLTCISTNSLTHTHSYRCRAFSPLVSPHVPPSAPRIPPTPTSPSWQSFQSSPRSHHPTLQSGMMSPTTLRPLAPLSPPDPDASHLIGSRLPRGNSSICSNSASSAPRPVPGPLLYTWSPRRPLETGVRVAITVPSTRTQCPTGTLCLIYTISLPHYRVPPFSPSWTWSAEEVGHGWTLLIKMAEVTLIDFSYLNRLALSTFTEGGPSFQIKIQGWGKS